MKISATMPAIVGLALLSQAAMADPITAGDPNLIPFTLQYGDFSVVSLQYADQITNSNQYYVASSSGTLKVNNYVVVGTGAGGNYANGSPGGTPSPTLPGIEAPYTFPNVTGNGQGYLQTGSTTGSKPSAPDPGITGSTTAPFTGGDFPGDSATTWDAQLSALKSALNGANAVFYFNLNENGVSDALSGTDMLAYGKVSVVNHTTGESLSFYLAGNPFDQSGTGKDGIQGALTSTDGGPATVNTFPADNTEVSCPGTGSGTVCPGYPPPTSFDTADPRWAVIHGNICVSNAGPFIHYGACTTADTNAQTVKQNLGANQAAFAFYNLTLAGLINGATSIVCSITAADGSNVYLHDGACTGADPAGATTFNTGAAGFDTLQGDIRMTDLDNGNEQIFLIGSGAPEIPEPSSLALLGVALIGFGGWSRYRRRSHPI